MTTPGFTNPPTQIAISDIDAEIGNYGGNPYWHQFDLNWLRSNGRTTVGAASGYSDMNNAHDKTWYSNNRWGANCNNGNQVHCNCNCGNKNCTNCTNCNAINCPNCDGTTKYLQPNCNCAPTFNCNVNSVSYNCDCNCFACW